MARSKKARALIPVFIAIMAGSGWLYSTRQTDDHQGTSPVSQMDYESFADAATDSVRSADSVMIYYDIHGEGDHALVFIHCWCCDRTYWDRQIEEFSKDYKVVTLDLAGHGQSGTNRVAWTMPAFGADVAAVVNTLDLNDVILVGHSMGGTVMIEAARLLGPRVTALVGVDNLQKLNRRFSEEEIQQYLANYRDDFAGVTYKFTKSLFPPGADSTLVNGIALEISSAPKEMALGAFANIFRYDYLTALREVRVPIRCINSDEYPTDVDNNRKVTESFEVTIMPKHGHYLFITDPDGFNANLHKTIEEFWPKANHAIIP